MIGFPFGQQVPQTPEFQGIFINKAYEYYLFNPLPFVMDTPETWDLSTVVELLGVLNNVEKATVNNASEVLAKGMYYGRQAMTIGGGFKAAQYSSALEPTTCDFCRSLDELVVDIRTNEGQNIYDRYSPQQHENCLCIWIYIHEDLDETVSPIIYNNEDFEGQWRPKLDKLTRNITKDQPLHDILSQYADFNLKTRDYLWEELGVTANSGAVNIDTSIALNRRRMSKIAGQIFLNFQQGMPLPAGIPVGTPAIIPPGGGSPATAPYGSPAVLPPGGGSPASSPYGTPSVIPPGGGSPPSGGYYTP